MTNDKKTNLTSLRHWTGTAFLSQKKRYTKNRSVCKNSVFSMGVAFLYSSAPDVVKSASPSTIGPFSIL